MAKKTKKSSQNPIHILLWGIVILLTITQSLTLGYIAKQHTATTEKTQDSKNDFVNSMEERRYRLPVIDIKEDRAYIPEARIYVPLNGNSRDIRYQYLGETLWLSTAIAVGRQIDQDVASCDKVVLVTPVKRADPNYTLAGTINAKDGSPRYIFKHNACKIYGEALSQSLADVAKEIQYY